MALVACAPRPFPEISTAQAHFQSTTGFTVANLLDVAGKKIAFVFNAPRAGTINKIGFLVGAVTTFQNIKVSLQDINTSTPAQPDGSVDQFYTFTSNQGANTYWETGLITSDGTTNGTKRTVALDEPVAIVIEFESTGGSLNVITQGTAGSRGWLGSQYCLFNNGTDWTTVTMFTSVPQFALEYDDGAGGFLYTPMLDIIPCKGTGSAASFTYLAFTNGNGANPDEAGNVFQVPFACKFGGFYAEGDWDGPMDVVLYSGSAGSASAQRTVSVATSFRARNGLNLYQHRFADFTPSINTDYRICVKPTDGVTSSVALAYFEVSKAQILDQMDGGQNCRWTQRVDAGSFAETATRRAIIGVLITALDDGTGSGGGSGLKYHPGMAGGFRG